MLSEEGSRKSLAIVRRARRKAWQGYFPRWYGYVLGVVLLGGMGLVEDLAPEYSGSAFVVVAAIALLVGLTRRGGLLVGRRTMPRSVWLGTAPGIHRGAVLWITALVSGGLVAMFVVGPKAWSAFPLPWTAIMLAMVLVTAIVLRVSARTIMRREGSA